MKKILLAINLVVFFVLGMFLSKFSTLSNTEKQNLSILKARAADGVGMICYNGCKQASPSDVCSFCVSSDCPKLKFGSIDWGSASNCSS